MSALSHASLGAVQLQAERRGPRPDGREGPERNNFEQRERGIREKEFELRRRELALYEREIELKKNELRRKEQELARAAAAGSVRTTGHIVRNREFPQLSPPKPQDMPPFPRGAGSSIPAG